MSYYLFRIDYDHGEFSYTEHFVMEAANEEEAKERLLDGLGYWFGNVDDPLVPDENGIFDNGDNEYSGEIVWEVSCDFVAECPPRMLELNFGRKP